MTGERPDRERATRWLIDDLPRAAVAWLPTVRWYGGKTLKTADGFALIDFEGEPSRSLAERRLKQCALKDVAGMLRSLDYAWAAVSRSSDHAEPHAGPGLAARSASRLAPPRDCCCAGSKRDRRCRRKRSRKEGEGVSQSFGRRSNDV